MLLCVMSYHVLRSCYGKIDGCPLQQFLLVEAARPELVNLSVGEASRNGDGLDSEAVLSKPALRNTSHHLKVTGWSVDDVCLWLGQLGLSKYSDTFRRNEMDGCELLSIDHAVLERELGIGKCRVGAWETG